jgi:hypothetical protein
VGVHQHRLSAHTIVPSLSTADLSWHLRYPSMRDLAAPLAEQLTHVATDRFFKPLYEAVLNATR